MSQLKKVPRAENVGRPDFVELEKQDRIQHNKTRGYDALPNPVAVGPHGEAVSRGPVMDPVNAAWRVGMSAEKYHAMTLKYEEQKRRNKIADDFRPELMPSEAEDYAKFLEKKEKVSK